LRRSVRLISPTYRPRPPCALCLSPIKAQRSTLYQGPPGFDGARFSFMNATGEMALSARWHWRSRASM
jgi:hypothetical protein